MVQIRENWADVEGTVRSVRPSGNRPDRCDVDLAVERVDPVEGFPNLVGEPSLGPLELTVVALADDLARAGVTEGARVRGRVRRATSTELFARRDGLARIADPEEA